jgi:putative oxidoreductase
MHSLEGHSMPTLSTARPGIRSAAGPLDLAAAGAWSALPLRLIVGCGLLLHGYAKLHRGPSSFAVVLHTLGVPAPLALAWLTTFVELAGGLAVLAGAFVLVASVPIATVLLTALFTVHLPYGFFSVKLVEVTSAGTTFGPVGYEIILLYLAGLSALVVGGAGPLSVDRWRSLRSGTPIGRQRRGAVA